MVATEAVAACAASLRERSEVSSSRNRRTSIRAYPTPSASPVIEPSATAVGSTSLTLPSRVITPKLTKTVVTPNTEMTSADSGEPSNSISRTKRIGIAYSSACFVVLIAESRSARSSVGWPVT